MNMSTKKKLPTAREVKTFLTQVDVGTYRISYDNRWGGEPSHPLYLRGDLEPKLLPYEAWTP